MFLGLSENQTVYNHLANGDYIPPHHDQYAYRKSLPNWIKQELYGVEVYKTMRSIAGITSLTRQEDNFIVNHDAKRVILLSNLCDMKEYNDYKDFTNKKNEHVFSELYLASALKLLHLVKVIQDMYPTYAIGFRVNSDCHDTLQQRVPNSGHSVFVSIVKNGKKWEASYFDPNSNGELLSIAFRQFGSTLHLKKYKRFGYFKDNDKGTCYGTSFVAMTTWINALEQDKFIFEGEQRFKGYSKKNPKSWRMLHSKAFMVRQLYHLYDCCQVEYSTLTRAKYNQLKDDDDE